MLRVELPSNSLLSGVVVCFCLKTFFPLFCMCVCLFLQKKKKKKNTHNNNNNNSSNSLQHNIVYT